MNHRLGLIPIGLYLIVATHSEFVPLQTGYDSAHKQVAQPPSVFVRDEIIKQEEKDYIKY